MQSVSKTVSATSAESLSRLVSSAWRTAALYLSLSFSLFFFFVRAIFTQSPVELHSYRRGAARLGAAAAGVAGKADINTDRS